MSAAVHNVTMTLAQARKAVHAGYTPDKRRAELLGDFPAFLVYRRVSRAVAPYVLVAGVSPNLITGAGLLLALLTPLLAWRVGYVAVGGAAILFQILDCLDGDVARASGASKAGALFDGFVDVCFGGLFFVSVGMLTDTLSLMLAARVLVLSHRVLRDHFATLHRERAEFADDAPAAGALAIARAFLISLEGWYGVVLLVAGATGHARSAAIGMAGYAAIIFVAAVGVTFRAAFRR